MNKILKLITYGTFFLLSLNLSAQNINSGKKVFETYCWGCHHQTSMAFGPSFTEIANKRDKGEIQGHIINPKATYIQLGYKRSVMPTFEKKLSQKELDIITDYILSFKDKK